MSARWSIGRVGQPRGLRGDVRVRLARDEPLYLEPARVLLSEDDPEPRRIQVKERQGPSVVLHVQGVDSREAAEALHGRSLFVLSDWYQGARPAEALVGARVEHADSGVRLGQVRDFYDNGAQVLLEVETATGRHLVPHVEAFFVGTEPPPSPGAAPVLRLRPIPGLLDEAE